MHKDGGNCTCSQPSLALFGLDKLVFLKMCLQRELSLLPTHNNLQVCLPTYPIVVECTVLGNILYLLNTDYISKRQPRTRDNFIQIYITSTMDATCNTSLNISSKSCWWSQLMKFHNLSWGTKTTPHLPRQFPVQAYIGIWPCPLSLFLPLSLTLFRHKNYTGIRWSLKTCNDRAPSYF